MAENEAVIFEGEKKVNLGTQPFPEVAANEVLIETKRSLISIGTELTQLSGEFPEGSDWDNNVNYPFTPGYCNIGQVISVGDNVEEDWVGERVATHNPHARFVTETAKNIISVPDEVSDGEAALFALAAIAANGVRRGRVTFGESIAVFGCGVIGQLTARWCRIAGAETIIGVNRTNTRLSYLPNEPGVEGVTSMRSDPDRRLKAETDGQLADVVFEVTGNPDAIVEEVDILREQGRLVILSSPSGETTLDFHDHCNHPSYEIIGAHTSSHPTNRNLSRSWTRNRHAELFLRLVADGRLSVKKMVSHVESYENSSEIYASLLKDRTEAMAVEFKW